MQFYNKRTIEEQSNRLPFEYQENFERTLLDRIEIDGCEIQGYFEYSFMEEKSYMEQPVRSQDGSIENLEDYSTFLTPRLIIKYNMMNIEDYRNLMTFLKSKNTFKVTCYDVVADRRCTHEMYFANPQMPIIYQRYLSAMGIQDYTIELIGTNRRTDDEKISITIDTDTQNAYSNDTWIAYLLREETDYKVVYSTSAKRFVISKDNGTTALCYGDGRTVSPHDVLVHAGIYSTNTYS